VPLWAWAGACVLGHACWGMHAGASQWPDRHGWPMTVALPQQVAQANLPRSRVCQRECQRSRMAGNRAWLRLARVCWRSAATAPRLAGSAEARGPPWAAGRGQRLTLQLANSTGLAEAAAGWSAGLRPSHTTGWLTRSAAAHTGWLRRNCRNREPLTAFERTQRPRRPRQLAVGCCRGHL
jgi:hypothetical protein